MNTIQFIKINENELLLNFNSNKIFKIKVSLSDLQDFVQKINIDILNKYNVSGPNKEQLENLKDTSYELYNILGFYEISNFLDNLKKNQFNHIKLILDKDTNFIPFEILHDGKDFLSDFIIFSRNFTDYSSFTLNGNSNNETNNFIIVGNPSESEDIFDDVIEECNSLSEIVKSRFNLFGPYTKKSVNKIELIRLLNISNCFHFSGHFKDSSSSSGWMLNNDIFEVNDINKVSSAPDFIYSNSCGETNDSYIYEFLKKGSKSIVSSMGKLPSKRAIEFSRFFYIYFILKEKSVGESFFLAIKDAKNKFGSEDLFWSFYRLYGNSSLKFKTKIKNGYSLKSSNKIKILVSIFIIISIIILYFFNFSNEDDSNLEIKDLVVYNSKNSKNITISNYKISDQNIKINDTLIYSKLSNEMVPSFSFKKDLSGTEVYLESEFKLISSLKYENDTLFYYNPESINDYNKYYFDFGPKAKDIQVYLRKKDHEVNDYDLYFFDKSNLLRYKISLQELINENEFNIFDVILLDQLDVGDYYKYNLSALDLIKNSITFNENFTLYIKKALFE